jgi:protein-disulfide isomerase
MAFGRMMTLAVGLLASAFALPVAAQNAADQRRAEIEAVVREYLASNPDDVQRIVKDYLQKNPDVLEAAIAEFIRKRTAQTAAQRPSAPEKAAVIKLNADAIFSSAHQVTLGNRQGDVTLVEFFDYNCGFCKRALADKLELLKSDPKLKIVLKELPVLGPGSVEAAQVAVAVRMQDPDGSKYLAFHQKLLGIRGPANKAGALAVAADIGLDVTRIERDLASAEIKTTLDEGRRLATVLGINGTPSYVVGDQVVIGAVGLAVLTERIKAARK